MFRRLPRQVWGTPAVWQPGPAGRSWCAPLSQNQPRDSGKPEPEKAAPGRNLPLPQLLAAIVDSSDDAIIAKTLDGQIWAWNQGAERIFGYSSSEAVGQSVTILIPPGDEDEEPRMMQRIRQGERIEHYETKRIRKDGIVIDVSLSISPIQDSRGLIMGASSIARDVTEQKRLEKERHRQAQREVDQLKKMNQLKSEFISKAAHELRTPLLPIRIQTHILTQGLKGLDDPQIKRALESLERNQERLNRLVDDLLEATRMQSARIKLVLQPFDISELLDEAADSFRPVGDQLGVRFVWRPKPGLVVEADPQRILQVLHNLLGNAMKFTPPGGAVELGVVRSEMSAEIRVRDTGAGLSANEIQTLFEPFTQASSAKTSEAHGSGLGLYISKGIVEQHGGHLRVESPGQGQGATFILLLPLSPKKRQPLALQTGPREEWWRDAPTRGTARRFKELI